MAGGLVDVEVDGDQEVERGEGPLQLRRVRGAAQRIRHQQDHRPHLALPRREDLLGHRRGGDQPLHLGLARHAALPASELEALALRQGGVDGSGGRREHHATGAVQVSRQQIQQIAAPARQGAELLHAGAEASIARGRFGCGELACDAADLGRGDATEVGPGFGCELRRDGLDLVEAVHPPLGRAEGDEALVEEGVYEAEQKDRVASRADEVVLAGELRRLRMARVHHDELAPACHHILQTPRRIGHRHQAAVRDGGVRADHEEVSGAVDVGNRHGHREGAAEHQSGLDDLRQRIDGRRVEAALRVEGAEQHGPVEQGTQVVDERVPRVQADGVVPVVLANRAQLLGDEGDGVVPGDLLPAGLGAAQRPGQAIGVVVELFHAPGLRTHEALREGVVGVALDAGDPVVFDVDAQATGGLAEGAGAMGGAGLGHRRGLLGRAPKGSATAAASKRATSRPGGRATRPGRRGFERGADPGRGCRRR